MKVIFTDRNSGMKSRQERPTRSCRYFCLLHVNGSRRLRESDVLIYGDDGYLMDASAQGKGFAQLIVEVLRHFVAVHPQLYALDADRRIA